MRIGQRRPAGRLALIAACCFAAAPLRADEVVVKNGDKLTGHLTDLAQGKLSLKTDYGGVIAIDLKQVSTFSTDHEVTLTLRDGSQVKGTVSPGEGATILLTAAGSATKRELKISDLEASVGPTRHRYGWSGSIGANIHAKENVKQHESLTAVAHGEHKEKKDTVVLDGEYDYSRTRHKSGKTDIDEDSWRLEGEYRHHLAGSTHAFVSALAYRDVLARVGQRLHAGAGIGRKLVDQSQVEVRLQLGLADLEEHFTDGTPSADGITGLLEYHVEWWPTNNLTVTHKLRYGPSLRSTSDHLIIGDLELSTNLTQGLSFDVRVGLDYDSTPARTARKETYRYFAGLTQKL
jgi:putative salt-induced outer membrane protein YdiY